MKNVTAIEALLAKRKIRLIEALPWVVAVVGYFVFPQYLQLGSQILLMIIFALSFDLLLGYTGIVTLGHAAFFGAGAYTAGLLAHYGWGEPLSALVAAALIAACLGAVTGAVILRTKGLALLMLGMAVALTLYEGVNNWTSITGGADGLQGVSNSPIFGLFQFDLFGKTAFCYSLAVLFVIWIVVRQFVNAPFGRSLIGIRQNPNRMEALGVSVFGRKLIVFTLSAAIAGVAGGLSAQTNQFVSMSTLSFELSGTVLVMLVIGGPGRLYGAFVGAALYMMAQDYLSKDQPVFWVFWVGLILVGLVLFNRGGVLGMMDVLGKKISKVADKEPAA